MSQEKESSGIQISDLSGLASISKEAREFLASVFGPLLRPAAEEIGELLADKIRQKRAENWIKVLEKSSQKAKQYNLKVKPARLEILAPIIENSSTDSDENKQNLWANLLLSEATNGDTHPAMPEILKQISSPEAKVLDSIYKNIEELRETTSRKEERELRERMNKGFLHSELSEKIGFRLYMVDNLIRLNLCQPSEIALRKGGMNCEYKGITLTTLGFRCVKAWSDPTSDTSPQTSAS